MSKFQNLYSRNDISKKNVIASLNSHTFVENIENLSKKEELRYCHKLQNPYHHHECHHNFEHYCKNKIICDKNKINCDKIKEQEECCIEDHDEDHESSRIRINISHC